VADGAGGGWSRRAAAVLAGCLAALAFAGEAAHAALVTERGRLAGCLPKGAGFRLAGPADRRAVALTFDDGPGPNTAGVLDVLERRRVPATFFVIGNLVRGRELLLRRALAHGSVLGNHTFTHAYVAGGGYRQIASTQAVVRGATGYTPCVFRAPGGVISRLLISQARAHGLHTVGWSVDPRDWSRPGSQAIYSRVVSAVRPGAIVLLHDGGGPRAQTVAALPRIIATLRARGYRFLTVPQLLRLPARYVPGAPTSPDVEAPELGRQSAP
jgi:peptidoglycan/xylan/chitin deacetylase (PgdA/CDA1 family)